MEDLEYNRDLVDALVHEFCVQTGRNPDNNRNNEALKKQAIKASVICEEMQCDPAAYVKAQTIHVPMKTNQLTIYPNQLCTESARDNVTKFRSVPRGNTREGLWDVQVGYLTHLLKKDTQSSVEEILLRPYLDFDPWFRCLITSKPVPSIIKKYGALARQQLQSEELKSFINDLRIQKGIELDVNRAYLHYD